jgi:hypothetical protein
MTDEKSGAPPSEGRVVLGVDEADALMAEGEQVHTFMQSGPALIGCDISRGTLLKRFRERGVELAGPAATAMKHGLVYFEGGRGVFVATKAGRSLADILKEKAENPAAPPGTEEGQCCARDGCAGTIEMRREGSCSCHINPPCEACVSARAHCPVCGWEEEG